MFHEDVYRDCAHSDNEMLQRKVADLCRTMLRGADTGVADPTDVVIRATMFHQRFRVSLDSIECERFDCDQNNCLFYRFATPEKLHNMPKACDKDILCGIHELGRGF